MRDSNSLIKECSLERKKRASGKIPVCQWSCVLNSVLVSACLKSRFCCRGFLSDRFWLQPLICFFTVTVQLHWPKYNLPVRNFGFSFPGLLCLSSGSRGGEAKVREGNEALRPSLSSRQSAWCCSDLRLWGLAAIQNQDQGLLTGRCPQSQTTTIDVSGERRGDTVGLSSLISTHHRWFIKRLFVQKQVCSRNQWLTQSHTEITVFLQSSVFHNKTTFSDLHTHSRLGLDGEKKMCVWI